MCDRNIMSEAQANQIQNSPNSGQMLRTHPISRQSNAVVGKRPFLARTCRSSRPIAVFASVDFNAGKPTSADRCSHSLNDCWPETQFSKWAPAIDQEPLLGSGARKQPFDPPNSPHRSFAVKIPLVVEDCSSAAGAVIQFYIPICGMFKSLTDGQNAAGADGQMGCSRELLASLICCALLV